MFQLNSFSFYLTGGADLAVDTPTLESFLTSSNVINGQIVVQDSNPVAETSTARSHRGKDNNCWLEGNI
jgi:hypothetical protein